MNGKEVFKFAVQKMPAVVNELLTRNGFTIDDLSLLVPHQANLRIIETGAARLGLPLERVMINVDRYGNTAAGSAVRDGRINRGDLVCLVSFGGGLSWAGTLIRW
jgi:3-oxoacyl-[acyl-carrier-protein] synthase-3